MNLLGVSDIEYSSEDLKIVYNYINKLINNFGTSNVYCKQISEKDYTIILDENHNYSDSSLNNNLNINFFLDDFYTNKEQSSIFINSRNSLLKIVSSSLKKVYKKIENINQKLQECEQMDKFRLYGELLTANLYKLNSNENLENVEIENYYDENKLITIPLDKSISVQKNIEKYFKKYNKLKNALSIVSIQKKEAEKELDYIETIVFNLGNSKNLNDINEVYEEIAENVLGKKVISQKEKIKHLKKKPKNENIDLQPISIDEFKIYVGKNNIQNDYISLKLASPNDIWFHVQKLHGSHVLLKNPENLEISEIPENVLFNCALLAKQNSKASNSLNVSVDYCLAKFVKKLSGSKPRNGYLQ